LTGTIKEKGFGIISQLEIRAMKPAVIKKEFGRVTKVLEDFI
jgi:hypothetical protein